MNRLIDYLQTLDYEKIDYNLIRITDFTVSASSLMLKDFFSSILRRNFLPTLFKKISSIDNLDGYTYITLGE